MSNASLVVRIESAIAKARAGGTSFDDLHREFELMVASLEGLPWPLLKRGRDLSQELWRESMLVAEAEEFDRRAELQELWEDLAEWLSAIREA